MIRTYTSTSKNSEVFVDTLESYHTYLFLPRSHLCAYDVNLTYPQKELIPSVPVRQPIQREIPFLLKSKRSFMADLQLKYSRQSQTLSKRDRGEGLHAWKRDLSLRVNGTLDPWVCGLYTDRCE